MTIFYWGLASFIFYKVAFAAAFQSISVIASLLLALMVGITIYYTSLRLAVVQGRHLALITLGRASIFSPSIVPIFGASIFASAILGKLIIYGFSEKLNRQISGWEVLYDLDSDRKIERATLCMCILIAPIVLHGITCIYAMLHSAMAAKSRKVAMMAKAAPEANVDDWEEMPGEPWKKRRFCGKPLPALEQQAPIISVKAESESLRNLEKGVSFYATSDQEGNLTFTLFDCSDAAHEHVGSDVASHVQICAKNQTSFLLKALNKEHGDFGSLSPTQTLNDVIKKFGGFYALERWLQQEGFPYCEVMDSWA